MKKIMSFVFLFLFIFLFSMDSEIEANSIEPPVKFPSTLGYDCLADDMFVCVSCAGGLFNYSKLGGAKICN